MKKVLVLALTLGLFMAFAMPAAAMDVKFSGVFYMQGLYIDNNSLLDKKTQSSVGTGATGSDATWAANSYDSRDNRNNRGAMSAYDGRLRMKTEFKIVEGLQLVTRFNALEREWGSMAWRNLTDSETRAQSGSSRANENIEFQQLYVDFKTALGQFQVGYQDITNFGTSFLWSPASEAAIRWQLDKGPASVFAKIAKERTKYNQQGNGQGLSATGATNFIANDADSDLYQLGAIGRFSAGEAGLMIQYVRDATLRRQFDSSATLYTANGFKSDIYMINPYAKLKFGNSFYVEAEGYYKFGNFRKYEDFGSSLNQPDMTIQAYGAFVNARVDVKPAYVGAQFVMMSGDDMSTQDRVTGSLAGGTNGLYENYAFNRALILWNAMYIDLAGPMYGNMRGGTGGYLNPRTGGSYGVTQFMDNVWFYQGYVGVKPMAKLDIKAALSYAYADQKPKMCVGSVGSACSTYNGSNQIAAGTANQQFVSGTYGYELDLTASYQIYDNLTYTIGGGYLWTGDYFKGYDSTVNVKDNYLITHQLVLAF